MLLPYCLPTCLPAHLLAHSELMRVTTHNVLFLQRKAATEWGQRVSELSFLYSLALAAGIYCLASTLFRLNYISLLCYMLQFCMP